MDSPIRLLVDSLQVNQVSELNAELTTGCEADRIDFAVPNPDEQYSVGNPALGRPGFFDTSGKRIKLELAGALSFQGILDSADFDVIPDNLIRCAGRDLTALLLDEIAGESLVNRLTGKGSSAIVRLIASEYGCRVDADEGAFVFSREHSFPSNSSVWEIVKTCATKENFYAYVDETGVLRFKKPTVPGAPSQVFAARPDAEGIHPQRLSFHQDKMMSLALKTRVVGFDRAKNRRVVGAAESPLRNRPGFKVIEVVDLTLSSQKQVDDLAWALLGAYSSGLVTGELDTQPEHAPARREGIAINGSPIADTQQGKFYVVGIGYRFPPGTMTVRFANRVLAFGRDEMIEKALKTPKERGDDKGLFPQGKDEKKGGMFG